MDGRGAGNHSDERAVDSLDLRDFKPELKRQNLDTTALKTVGEQKNKVKDVLGAQIDKVQRYIQANSGKDDADEDVQDMLENMVNT